MNQLPTHASQCQTPPPLDTDGTTPGKLGHEWTEYWPKQPGWRNSYPTDDGIACLAELIRANSIQKVYYRGLADELVIRAILQSNPEAQLIVWDYWGYWTHEWYNDHDDIPPAKTPDWPWGPGQLVFQYEGTPLWFPDLLIVDKDCRARELCAITKARFIALSGTSREMKDTERYAWRETSHFSIGEAKSHSVEGRNEGDQTWHLSFFGRPR